MSAFWFAVASALFLVAVLIALPLLLGRRTVVSESSASQSTPQEASSPDLVTKIKSYWPLITGIILALIGVVAISGKVENIDLGFWLVFIVLAGIAILGAIKSTTNGARWVTRIFAVGMIAFVGAHLLFGDEAPKVLKRAQQDAARAVLEEKSRVVEEQHGLSSAQQMPIVKEAEWESGRPVVGQWSRTFQIPVGCATKYGTGNGTLYRVRYRLHEHSDWKEHQSGAIEPASEIQFMLLQEGSGMPFTLKCS